MALFLTEKDVEQLVTMEMALQAVERALRLQGEGAGEVKPRQRVRTGKAMLQVLPATSGSAAGLKFYCGTRAGVRFWVPLFDGESGEMLAFMQADKLGQMRTGAASGIATKYMARKDASVLGLFGTGWQAETQAAAICAVRPIKEVKVFGRNREKGEAFCRRMSQQLQADFRFIPDAREVVRGSDIVTTITTADQPLFDGNWLEPGTHINAAGSNRAQAREIDATAVERAAIVATDLIEQAKIESGDLIGAAAEGRFDWTRAVELGRIVTGQAPGRNAPDEITLFASHGIGLWDVTIAEAIYRKALEAGVGQHIDL